MSKGIGRMKRRGYFRIATVMESVSLESDSVLTPRLLIGLISALIFIPSFTLTRIAQADPGDLDPSFGGNGKVLAHFAGNSDEEISAIAIQADGKIVAAGSSSARGRFDFALARYNTDGTRDDTFSANGKLLTDFRGSGSFDLAHAVAIQTDGKIVAAGHSAKGNDNFALARYLAAGGRDCTGTGSLSIKGSVDNKQGKPVHGVTLTLKGPGGLRVAQQQTHPENIGSRP
ncbi:MAG: hypothetical protein C4291_09145 [Candidatus Dadabacteria bacterium]